MVRGGDPLSRMWIQTWQPIDDVVIAKGIRTESEVADMRRAYKDPTFTYRAQLMQSVWGRGRLLAVVTVMSVATYLKNFVLLSDNDVVR